MEIALAVSKRALPNCAPNPPVGCVIVAEDDIIAQGFTHPPGEPHAEIHALSQVPDNLNNLTIYVTLEPCSFFGKTPSCAEAISADSRISKVVVAIIDPDPRNNGMGINILRAKGIEVIIGPIHEKVSAFLRPFLQKN